jgi:hypothetical protein
MFHNNKEVHHDEMVADLKKIVMSTELLDYIVSGREKSISNLLRLEAIYVKYAGEFIQKILSILDDSKNTFANKRYLISNHLDDLIECLSSKRKDSLLPEIRNIKAELDKLTKKLVLESKIPNPETPVVHHRYRSW